ncbi:MAG: DUF4124 domain-containing protein [Gammaproteobacteria bacterium]|nr:MAG: DUF4124 domain-containing protein [Gammaproteobacteria bacterium]
MSKASTLAIACLVAVSMTYAIAAPVFTWVDQDGVTHYSETPPVNHSVESDMIELEPAPAAGPAPDDDYFSVIRQAERMEKSRLENEKARTERLQAEAAVRQAAAAERSRSASNYDETKRYYPAYPVYGYRRGYHPGFKPGYWPGHRPGHRSSIRPGYRTGHRAGRRGSLPGYGYGAYPGRTISRVH